MAAKIVLAEAFQSKDRVDQLTKWVMSKGRNPWKPGFFKDPNPLEKLTETFQSYCDSRRLKLGSVSTHAAWGLYTALQDSVAQIRELQTASVSLEQDLQLALENQEREYALKLSDREARLESLGKDLEREIGERDAVISKLHRKIEQLQGEKFDLLVDKNHYANLVQEKDLQCQQALLRAEEASAKVKELGKLHDQAQSAAQFLAREKAAQVSAISHDACRHEIESLKQKLGLQTALIATVHPETLPSLPDLSHTEQVLPAEAVSHLPINPDWTETPTPVHPVQHETVRRHMANGRVEVTNQERVMIWKPHEAKAIGDQLGPLNRDTGVQWLCTTLEQYPTASGEDLCQLVRVCATGPDTQALRNGLLQRNMAQLGPMNWAREIAKLLWPGQSAELLFLTDKQGPDENPESYSSRKCFLAQLAEKVQANAEGIWNFNVDNFKTPFYNGLNTRTKIAIGMFDPTNIAWYALEEKVRLAGDLFREAAHARGSQVKHPKKSPQEPVQAVTYANNGPHSTHKWNGGSDKQPWDLSAKWSGYRGGNKGGAKPGPERPAAAPGNGLSPNNPFGPRPSPLPRNTVPAPAQPSAPMAPASLAPAEAARKSVRNWFWFRLKEMGQDMRQFDQQPLEVMIQAYTDLMRALPAPAAGAQPVASLQDPENPFPYYPGFPEAEGGSE
ncbi:uncharacterized protein LOC143836454 [Paroedura picta]|uniref:uncharacterized protein LOC143836454 n=1 Tax=Paroedura picta TaxID=143630 RepID=UPI00405646DC